MRNETFYATAAQVLPTLLVAIMVESAFLLRFLWRAKEGGPEALSNDRETSLKEAEKLMLTAAVSLFIVAGAFIIGELSALATLLTGLGGWWPNLAGPLVAFALVVLTLAGVAVPWMGIAARVNGLYVHVWRPGDRKE